MDDTLRAVFEGTYAAPPSRVQERVWRSVLGDEYPDGLDPYSYVSRTELGRFVRETLVGPGDVLVDLGCGRGGAGLWVSTATGARLVGIDIAEAALDAARERSSRLGADASFRRGTFEATGLEAGSADAIMSVDAFLFTPDKVAAMVELRRILRPGGRLVLTSWDYHAQPVGRPPQVPDHRPVARAAGFSVLAYEDTEHWRERVLGTGLGLRDAVDELAAEDGAPVDEVRASIDQMLATYETMTRRFLLVAEAI
jgi:SAM-dependent methyltransferase